MGKEVISETRHKDFFIEISEVVSQKTGKKFYSTKIFTEYEHEKYGKKRDYSCIDFKLDDYLQAWRIAREYISKVQNGQAPQMMRPDTEEPTDGDFEADDIPF